MCHEISLETDHQREEEGKSGASNVLSPRQTSMVQLELTEDLTKGLTRANQHLHSVLHELRSDCLQDTAETALGTTRGK